MTDRRVVVVMPDPWMGLCLALAHPGAPVVAFGAEPERALFAARGIRAALAPPPSDPSTPALLEDPAVAALIAERPSTLICFKPSRRITQLAEALGAVVALAPAVLAQGLENKLALPALAEAAGVAFPVQESTRLDPALSWPAARDRWGDRFVVQSPRGFSGNRTFLVEDAVGLREVVGLLGGRPIKVSSRILGRPGTLHVVVDSAGRAAVSAPIVQVTGVSVLTPYGLGSCGNDFTWRPDPQPGEAPALLAERLARTLAGRGYRGSFGVDFVLREGAQGVEAVLIEVNPRLTGSFALYAQRRPELLRLHLLAWAGGAIPARRLPPLPGGQLIFRNTEAQDAPPAPTPDGVPEGLAPDALEGGSTFWSVPLPSVTPGSHSGRLVTEGVVVDAEGRVPLLPGAPPSDGPLAGPRAATRK